jgi:hypothetical protein
VARAKRTDRTEARRRYRAEQAALGDDPTTDVVVEAAPAKGKSTSSKASATAPAPRPGIVASFKAAYHPVDLRADLRAAPKVLTHWGVLVACAISIASAAVFIISTNDLASTIDFTASNPTAGKTFGTASNVSALVITMFLQPPPIAGAFLVGFTAKRASWMGGLLVGIVAAVCWAIVLSNPAGKLLTGGQAGGEAIISGAALSPVGAALFASAAAWYRRFLDLANPNRNQPRGKQGTKQGGSSGKKTASSSARR